MPTVSSPRLLAWVAGAAVCVLSLLAISPQPAPADDMPYNATNPFIWDNDSESDAFALDFVMALAHIGSLKLIGISESPHPWKSTSENYQAIVEKARNSGWHNIPDASWDLGSYYMTALSRPSDGSIDSTAPLNTAPARMIMDKVLSVGTSSQPVVVGTGGALTTVASAYLLANQAGRGAEFASKMVLYAGIGADGAHVLNGYNESQDEWAVYVCQQRLKVVFTEYTNADHNQPKFWAMIDALPDNEIGQYMKTTKANWPYAPYQGVGDEMPVLTLLNPRQGSYFNSTERVTFDHWDSAAWSWGAPGPNNINWDAYPAYLNLRSEPSADDIAVWRLNAEDDFITGTFTHAFASASAGGSDTAARPRGALRRATPQAPS